MISFLILLQRFVRAEGRATEAFWIYTCKLLPPELWRTARESVSLGRPVLKDRAQQEAEEEISQKTWEAMHLQVKGDLEKKELQER